MRPYTYERKKFTSACIQQTHHNFLFVISMKATAEMKIEKRRRKTN